MDSTVLDPENYLITSADVTIVTQSGAVHFIPVVDSIYFLNDSTVICLTTPHVIGSFRVKVDSVKDLAGNLIDSTFNFAFYIKE
jgi:hypothetical protein